MRNNNYDDRDEQLINEEIEQLEREEQFLK